MTTHYVVNRLKLPCPLTGAQIKQIVRDLATEASVNFRDEVYFVSDGKRRSGIGQDGDYPLQHIAVTPGLDKKGLLGEFDDTDTYDMVFIGNCDWPMDEHSHEEVQANQIDIKDALDIYTEEFKDKATALCG